MPETPADLFERYGVDYRPESPLLCAPDEKKRIEAHNQREVVTYVTRFYEDFEGRSPHSTQVLHDLHTMVIKNIYPCGGTFRDATVDITITGSAHHPPPCDEVPPLLNEMFSPARNWDRDWSPHQRVAMAASNFHKFLNIHPYRGGNGRVARAHLNLSLYEMEVIQPPLTLFEYMHYRRDQYMAVLHAGDRGDLAPMHRFIERGIFDAYVGQAFALLLDPADPTSVRPNLEKRLKRKEQKFIIDARNRRRLSDHVFEKKMEDFVATLRRITRSSSS